jgi:hypothetical protein
VSILNGAFNNTVGPDEGSGDQAKRNIIAGNNGAGVLIDGPGTSFNTVASNFIGANASGMALPNSTGVQIQNGASDNTIGAASGSGSPIPNSVGAVPRAVGSAGEGGNVIANNTGNGISVAGTSSVGNLFSRNSIFNNGELGIDLVTVGQASNGVSLNDAPTSTGRGQRPQRRAELPRHLAGHLRERGRHGQISGTLRSRADRSYEIEIFNSSSPDPSTYGEGQSFLNSVAVTTDAQGTADFELLVAGPITSLSATAIDTSPATPRSSAPRARRSRPRFRSRSRPHSSPRTTARARRPELSRATLRLRARSPSRLRAATPQRPPSRPAW